MTFLVTQQRSGDSSSCAPLESSVNTSQRASAGAHRKCNLTDSSSGTHERAGWVDVHSTLTNGGLDHHGLTTVAGPAGRAPAPPTAPMSISSSWWLPDSAPTPTPADGAAAVPAFAASAFSARKEMASSTSSRLKAGTSSVSSPSKENSKPPAPRDAIEARGKQRG